MAEMSVEQLLERIAHLMETANSDNERRHQELLQKIDSIETWVSMIHLSQD